MESNLYKSHSRAAFYESIPKSIDIDTSGHNYELPGFQSSDKSLLKGKRVLIISADGSELPEIDYPIQYLKARGAEVVIAGQHWIFEYRKPPGYIVIAQWLADNICIKADLDLRDVSVGDYDDNNKTLKKKFDALFIPGGAWNPDMLRVDDDALRIVREASAHGLLIVSLCHGPQVVINAAQSDPRGQEVFPPGTFITGVPSIWLDLTNAGFTVLDQPVVFDQDARLLTARTPEDLAALCNDMERLLLGM